MQSPLFPPGKFLSLLFACLALLSPLVARAEIKGYVVFEIDRGPYQLSKGSTPEIKRSFKVALSDEFLARFRHKAGQNSSGTGFCFNGGNLTNVPDSTRFMWWIRQSSDGRWAINVWGKGSEIIDGVKISSWNPGSSQSLLIRNWEDLDMSSMLSYDGADSHGLNVAFTVRYVPAKDLPQEKQIPTIPVHGENRSELIKGDDLSHCPIGASCSFQEG